MTTARQAIIAEPWAIQDDWLRLLARLASGDRDERATQRAREGEEWQRRELACLAGTRLRRLEGARYAMTTDEGVAVIPLLGPVFPRANIMSEMSGAVSTSMLANDLRLAQANPDVDAIMLVIDSPGGVPTGVSTLSDDMFRARSTGKRVMAHVAGSCCSAAYWIGSAANEVVLAESIVRVGCIGVVAAVPKQVEPDASGELVIEIVSSNASDKRPDPQTDEGVATIRATLDEIETQFIAAVARNRGVSADKVKSDFGQGGVKVGASAIAAGMADRIQNYEASFAELAATARDARRRRVMRR